MNTGKIKTQEEIDAVKAVNLNINGQMKHSTAWTMIMVLNDPHLRADLLDYLLLGRMMEIYVDSDEHKRLLELAERFDKPEYHGWLY